MKKNVNMKYDFGVDTEDFGISGIEDNSRDWLVSYSDIVTLLLCFFIMFFNAKTGGSLSSAAKTLEENPVEEIKEKAPPVETIAITTEEISQEFADLEGVFSFVNNLPNIKTIKNKDHFIVVFEDAEFYRTGSFQLKTNGRNLIEEVVDRLISHSDKIYVEIQGHADKTPIKRVRKHAGYSTNIELSAKRALHVYDLFKEQGFPETSLSVSGYSNHRPYNVDDLMPDEIELLEKNRRISFRIEAK